MSPETIALVIGVAFAGYMAWNIGANDVANAMGTSVGSGALTLTMAVVLAGVFEFAGATLVGTHVTETVRKGILHITLFQAGAEGFDADPVMILMLGMVSSLLAAGVWLQIATAFGLPVSTTHSIIGALIGFGLMAVGSAAVDWTTVGQVAASWVISPVLGGGIAAAMFVLIRRVVLRTPDPAAATRRVAPHLVALVVFLLVVSFVYKVLANLFTAPPWWTTVVAAAAAAGVAYLISRSLVVTGGPGNGRWKDHWNSLPGVGTAPAASFGYVERVFGRLQVVTACYVAFAHGANDVANAAGPIAAVVQIHEMGELVTEVPVPAWILVLTASGIVLGLATWGYKVIRTVGEALTELTPSRGFSAEFGAATTVLIASLLGMPVSTTHTLVGAVVGVGLARGIGALDLRMVWRVIQSWIVTLPVAAAFAAASYAGLKALLL
jgi:PiT family inorganic phosphate transporter